MFLFVVYAYLGVSEKVTPRDLGVVESGTDPWNDLLVGDTELWNNFPFGERFCEPGMDRGALELI